MKKHLLILTFLTFALGSRAADTGFSYQNSLNNTATPLVSVDPYFSIWSFGHDLNGDVTRHWSGRKQPLLAAVRVDGKVYRVLGKENAIAGVPEGSDKNKPDPYYNVEVPETFSTAAVQLYSNLLPTRSIYGFECGPVKVELVFTAPLLPDDLDLLSRPVNYLTFNVEVIDGRKHTVEIYMEASPRIATDLNVVPIIAETGSADGIKYLRTGTVEQNYLSRHGDDLRIDWGYFYLAPADGKGTLAVTKGQLSRSFFARSGKVDTKTFGKQKTITSDNYVAQDIVLAYSADLGKLKKDKSLTMLLAYDDVYSIKYLEQNLRPYWNRKGDNKITREMSRAAKDMDKIMARCRDFEQSMLSDAQACGGTEYADLCASAYRQAVSAHKLLEGPSGDIFFISKENFSNGCAGTVDVSYPSIPLFLYYNNELAKGLLNHVFEYAESTAWNNVWAPHDVGRYPIAYGQHYGNWMPLEECGNMLLMTAAIVQQDPEASYARRHWTELTKWALYAIGNGQNPENQLCTDDFAGKLAHNVNLSAKSILAVGAYSKMARSLGKIEEANAFMAIARRMAAIWKETAFEEDHYKLAFDQSGTWSQKYNLVWDKILGLDLFGQNVIETELSYYAGKQNRFGLPLDSRRGYTKTDWIMWTASMAPDIDTFRKFMLPVHDFYNNATLPGPMSDWVETETPESHVMRGRSVVGGFFMKMYADRRNALNAASAGMVPVSGKRR